MAPTLCKVAEHTNDPTGPPSHMYRRNPSQNICEAADPTHIATEMSSSRAVEDIKKKHLARHGKRSYKIVQVVKKTL